MEMSLPKYHTTITNIQDLVDEISKGTSTTKVLGESIEEYISTILDEVLDSNPDIFGETNHMSYFYENPSDYKVVFENIGKVQKCTFTFGKNDINLEKELITSLWGVYSYKVSYENHIPNKIDANHFANAMKVYFSLDGISLLSNS